MQIYPILIQNNNYRTGAGIQSTPNLETLVAQIGQKTLLPDSRRNFSVLNQPLVKDIVAQKEVALPHLMRFLSVVQDERQITEGLYILDRMIDAGVNGVEKTYPVISRFNKTNSPNVQVMLAGIYRKTQVPDGFGPLMSMLLKNTFYPQNVSFDPNEEVGGAILDYLRNKSATTQYLKQ